MESVHYYYLKYCSWEENKCYLWHARLSIQRSNPAYRAFDANFWTRTAWNRPRWQIWSPSISSSFRNFGTFPGTFVVGMFKTSDRPYLVKKRKAAESLPGTTGANNNTRYRESTMSEHSNEYGSSNGDIDESFANEDVSLDDLLRAKLDRIEELEQEISEKDREVANMRQKVVEMEVKRKHQIYKLRVDSETCRREKDATEERLAEVYKDMQLLVQLGIESTDADADTDTDLEESAAKFQQALVINDSQMQMVRTSYDEIIKTLKEEIVEITDAGSQQELVLINELKELDEQKKDSEAYLFRKIEEKEGLIEMLRCRGQDGQSMCSGDIEELETELSALLLDKRNLVEELALEQETSKEAINILKHSNTMLEVKVQSLTEDIAVLRAGGEVKRAIDKMIKSEEDIGYFIDRVAEIREQTESSVDKLAQIIRVAKADMDLEDSEAEIGDDAEMVLSISESAALVHDQANLSLRLIELQLQNGLKALRNEKHGLGENAPKDIILIRKMDQIRDETMRAISKAERAYSEQMKRLDERALSDVNTLKKALDRSNESVKKLENDNSSLRSAIGSSKGKGRSADEQSHGEEKASEVETLSVNKQTIDQLETEILRVVATVKLKNEAIETLSKELSVHKIREEELQAQLSRVCAFPSSPAADSKTTTRTGRSSIASEQQPSSSRPSYDQEHKENAIAMKKKSPRAVTLIKPLRPSSREVFGAQSAKRNTKSG